jgi:hypothetical protein
MHHRASARLLWVLLAALQLVGAGAAAIADARLEAASRSAVAPVHVEDHSSTRCPRVHPADCALCQFVTRALATPPKAPPIPAALAIRTPVETERPVTAAHAIARLPLSRAPPLRG